MVRTYRCVFIDVFTDVPLAGNQLAVFTDARGLPEHRMQALAREIGFSETTFVLPAEGEGDIRIRIFTPSQELAFAGHPTLGTAFVVGGPLQRALVRVETARAIVPVQLEREGARIVFGVMSQPLPSSEPFADTAGLLAALGVPASTLPVTRYDNGTPHVLVGLPSPADVAALAPDHRALERVIGAAGACCFSAEGPDVRARVFVPGLGAGEDAATGSAAGPLAVHLARHGRVGWGEEVVITQGVEMGRPSRLRARVEGCADSLESVEVGGSAVVVGRAEFAL